MPALECIKIVKMLFSPWHSSLSSRLHREPTHLSWSFLVLAVALIVTSSCTPGRTWAAWADLPVQLVNNIVFVSVRAGSSEPLSFVLDTGASATVLNRTVAERLGLNLQASQDARTGGGSVQTASATGITLSVANVSPPDITIVAIDLNGLHGPRTAGRWHSGI